VRGLASAAISYGGRFEKERLAPHTPVRQHAPREFRRYQRNSSGSLATLAAIRCASSGM
jgi:hypothetical protein